MISFNPLDGVRKPTSVGIPLPATEIQVVDLEDGTNVLETGQKGEIRVAGPQVMRGYRNRPEETAQTLRDGWLYTGDIGELERRVTCTSAPEKRKCSSYPAINVFPRRLKRSCIRTPASGKRLLSQRKMPTAASCRSHLSARERERRR